MRSIFAPTIVFIWLGLLAALNCAFAASYPSRPVRIIVVSLPGSPNDLTSRVVGNHLTELWGQQFIVDNRSGAGGQIAMELAAKASPDGYTIVNSGDGPMAISPAIKRNLPYGPLKDFEPVAFTAFTDYILVVNPSLPVHSGTGSGSACQEQARSALRFRRGRFYEPIGKGAFQVQGGH